MLTGLLLLRLISETCCMSTSAWVVFKWHHLGWPGRQSFGYILWHVELKTASIDVISLFKMVGDLDSSLL